MNALVEIKYLYPIKKRLSRLVAAILIFLGNHING